VSQASRIPKVLAPDSYDLTRLGLEKKAIDLCATLAPQEIEVLRLLAHGLSLRVVGEEMGLHVLTIKHYVGNIARKTGHCGRGNMVRLALRAGVASLWITHPAERVEQVDSGRDKR